MIKANVIQSGCRLKRRNVSTNVSVFIGAQNHRHGKIIQELESEFRGAGWNVIKVVWGGHWDALFARDKKGILMQRLGEIVDGQYQTMKAKNGAVESGASDWSTHHY